MIEIKLQGHALQLYHAAAELPIRRYSLFQKYNLMESGIGSDIESIGGHFAKLFEFIGQEMNEEAQTEAKNLYYNFYSLLQTISFPGLAFVCMVHSIDGKELTDVSEDNLTVVLEQLSAFGLTYAMVQEWMGGLKKNSN